ncbi:MAG: universal stress protein [Deltaproteobacteria bacterium]|nr:universal stress protein [Deltaproteobacteria bacterium]
MYRKILFCLDNSAYANTGIDLGLEIAKEHNASNAGCHVYAAKLHNDRFREMEDGLPPQYQQGEILKNQREVHDTLITRGLKIISDSYTSVLHAKSKVLGLDSIGISREGKNYEQLVLEITEGGYDLAVIGAFGLGKTESGRIGSVCERVIRRINIDTLVTRDTLSTNPQGSILVAIDGSPQSFGGLLTALELSKVFNRKVEAVSAFDPCFHQTAFRSIAGVLSVEAGRLFKFSEQEKLHEEIIDKGLARIYQEHLDTAVSIGKEKGIEVKATLLSGKPFNEILKYMKKTSPFMLIIGRTGVHASPTLDIGSTTENCMRESDCHILISSRKYSPDAGAKKIDAITWTDEAKTILERIPQFARGVVKNMVENSARSAGLDEVTAEFMHTVRKKMEE